LENKTTLTTGQRFFRLLKRDRKEISYIYLYAVIAGIINLTLPLGVQAILNFIQGGNISSSWWLLIVIVTLGVILAGVVTIMQMTVSETLQRRIFTRVSFDLAERLPLLKTETIRREYVPELVNRFFDTLTIQKGLPKILIDLSTAVMQILFGIILLSFYHPFFIFFGVLLLTILIIIFRFTSPRGLKTSLMESKYKYQVAHWLEEIGRTIHTFKLAGRSELPLSRTDSLVTNYLDAKEKHFAILKTQYISIVTFKSLITFVLLTLGSYLVINNQINIGQFVAAELIVLLIINSAEKLIYTMETVYDVMTAIEKLGAVADLPIESEEGLDFKEVNTQKGISVEINGLTHYFSDSNKPTLKDINLSVKAGQKICIAGYNGSGKTTLVQLIACLLTEYEGSMLYNGIPRKNFNQRSLRHYIGDFSSQEDIFKGTLLENISLGYPNVRFQDVVKTADAVGLSPFIRTLPQGFETPILPEGKNLPRSVIMKIILTRSLVNNPQLLAIEELMANLEYNDRVHIASLLTDKSNTWTLIAVTDDPILAARCEHVYIMDKGEIVADGTFEDIKRTSHFKKVFKTSN
jgi:ABC-type bacteriocin/lantibiotic exporter with double-glycine peptidase domain